jgi:hypothetical protein
MTLRRADDAREQRGCDEAKARRWQIEPPLRHDGRDQEEQVRDQEKRNHQETETERDRGRVPCPRRGAAPRERGGYGEQYCEPQRKRRSSGDVTGGICHAV